MDKEAVADKERGGGVTGAVVVVSAEAAAAELRSISELDSNIKEEGCGRMKSRMRTAAAEVEEEAKAEAEAEAEVEVEAEAATAMMRQSGVRVPVSVQHELPVWLTHW